PLRKHFAARRDSTALLGGERLAIHAGERLAMNHSYKYAAEAFLQILDQAGLDVQWRGVSDDQRFQMVLAGPKWRAVWRWAGGGRPAADHAGRALAHKPSLQERGQGFSPNPRPSGSQGTGAGRERR